MVALELPAAMSKVEVVGLVESNTGRQAVLVSGEQEAGQPDRNWFTSQTAADLCTQSRPRTRQMGPVYCPILGREPTTKNRARSDQNSLYVREACEGTVYASNRYETRTSELSREAPRDEAGDGRAQVQTTPTLISAEKRLEETNSLPCVLEGSSSHMPRVLNSTVEVPICKSRNISAADEQPEVLRERSLEKNVKHWSSIHFLLSAALRPQYSTTVKEDDCSRRARRRVHTRSRSAGYGALRVVPEKYLLDRTHASVLGASNQRVLRWLAPHTGESGVQLSSSSAAAAAAAAAPRSVTGTGALVSRPREGGSEHAAPKCSSKSFTARKRGRNISCTLNSNVNKCSSRDADSDGSSAVTEMIPDTEHILIHQAGVSSLAVEVDGEIDPWLIIATLPPREYAAPAPQIRLPKPDPAVRDRPTLVLDLDETLVHCSTEFMSDADFNFSVHFEGTNYTVYVKRRPFLQALLQYAARYFEVVVFTASQKAYADRLLNILDPDHTLIHHRLFRDACINVAGNYLKDLTVLSRDLRRTIIVDNSPQAFGYHLGNGVPILTWTDDENDRELIQLIHLLEDMRDELEHGSGDVRFLVERRFRNKNRVEFYRAFLASIDSAQ
jgi:CTD small phosphatase-like protein 2